MKTAAERIVVALGGFVLIAMVGGPLIGATAWVVQLFASGRWLLGLFVSTGLLGLIVYFVLQVHNDRSQK